MASNVLYAIDIKKVGTISLIGLIIGAILTFVPMNSLINLIIVMVALIVIVSHGASLYKRIMENQENNKTTNEMLLDVLGIFAGFMLIMLNSLVTIIIVSIYLLIEPLVYLFLTKFDKKELMIELPKLGLGLVLLLGGINKFNLVFQIIGIIILVLSATYFGINYYLYKKSGIKIMN